MFLCVCRLPSWAPAVTRIYSIHTWNQVSTAGQQEKIIAIFMMKINTIENVCPSPSKEGELRYQPLIGNMVTRYNSQRL